MFTTLEQFTILYNEAYQEFISVDYTEEELYNAKKLLSEESALLFVCKAASLMGLAKAIEEKKRKIE